MPRTTKEMKSEKPFFVIANWKMNKTIREALAYVEKLKPLVEDLSVSLMLAVPFTAISNVKKALGENVRVGAQNMNDASKGAFTGEIAAVMIEEAGGDFVLLGHSERRQYFKESNDFINKKIVLALETSLTPVLCIGENYDQRQANETESFLKQQLEECLKEISTEQIQKCIIAYEPVWAIGTGMTATPELVQETHAIIRTILTTLYNKEVGESTPLLYGGSVSENTAEKLASTEGVNGFLIGTASLDPESFAKIARISENVHH